MPHNVPDDWGMYWSVCSDCGERYHACGGGHDCPEGDQTSKSKRPWLKNSGYEYDHEGQEWIARVRESRHIARRDHKDGRIKKGDHYYVIVTRAIDDETGESWHRQFKSRF